MLKRAAATLLQKQRSAKSDTSRAPPQVSAGRADEGSDDDRANSALPEETAASRRKEDFDRLRKETMKSRQAVKVLTGADAQKVTLQYVILVLTHLDFEVVLYFEFGY